MEKIAEIASFLKLFLFYPQFQFILPFLVYSNLQADLPPPTSEPELSKQKITEWYYQGEFDRVIELLEFYRSSNKEITKEDTIFVFKYLGIIYASDPEERTKGEGFLYSLVKISPQVNMADMHLSEDLEELFQKIKNRYLKEHPPKKKKIKHIEKKIQSEKKTRKRKKKTRPWLRWTAGGVVVAFIVTYTIFSFQKDEPPKTTKITIQ